MYALAGLVGGFNRNGAKGGIVGQQKQRMRQYLQRTVEIGTARPKEWRHFVWPALFLPFTRFPMLAKHSNDRFPSNANKSDPIDRLFDAKRYDDCSTCADCSRRAGASISYEFPGIDCFFGQRLLLLLIILHVRVNEAINREEFGYE